MSDGPRSDSAVSGAEPKGCGGLVLRLTWMVFGNLALFVAAALIARGDSSAILMAAYGVSVAGLIAVRYVDIAKFAGTTSEGEPATLADWRRYALGVVVFSAGLWALARLAASRGWLG